MKKGKLIGIGMTAGVYEWGEDKVLKLFYRGYNVKRAEYEADIGHRVHEAGVCSPAVYDMVNIDGRTGIIYQRIFGRSILNHVMTEPLNTSYFTQKMAGLQFKIHGRSVDKLPSQKDRLALEIEKSSKTLGNDVKKILLYLKNLPEGKSVCHGDLHFGNVMVSNRGLIAVDWINATSGNPMGDVARTCLNFKSPVFFLGPSSIILPFKYGKGIVYRNYLKEYMRLANTRFKAINEWMLPVAAARLSDGIPGEKCWLMGIIGKRLARI